MPDPESGTEKEVEIPRRKEHVWLISRQVLEMGFEGRRVPCEQGLGGGRAGLAAWAKLEGGEGRVGASPFSTLTPQPQPTVHRGTRAGRDPGPSSGKPGQHSRGEVRT